MADHQVWSSTLYSKSSPVTFGAKTTLSSAAIASPATAKLACKPECGLRFHDDDRLQLIAGQHASVQTLHTLRELGLPFGVVLVSSVALSGRLDILQHLLVEQRLWTPPCRLSYNAARSGNITMLDWLKRGRWCSFGQDACAGAARAGKLATLQHLRSKGCDWDIYDIACCAAKSGSIEVVEWLRQRRDIVIGATVMSAAASAGHIHMCEHLRSSGCEWDDGACHEAAAADELDTLRWLREHGCPWDSFNVFFDAACRGSIAILEYVAAQGEVLDAEQRLGAMNGAATYNQLQAAQWLRQQGAQWPAVLGYGNEQHVWRWTDAMLAWARAEGCTSPVLL
jgi:hypothetical protein